MASPEDILADNLKEALKEAHKHIVFGTTAALFLLLLVVQDWWGGGESTIKVPFVEVSADKALAEVIAGVAYFISGYLAYLSISRARRIMMRLSSSPQLREAVLMYPSIPTLINTGTRMAAILLPMIIFLASTVPFLFKTGDKWWGLLWIIFMLNAPWILLILRLRYPLSEIKYKLTEQSLKLLRENGIDEGIVARLQAIKDKEYPNRDQFLEVIQKVVGKGLPVKTTRIILTIACEEEGEDN